MSVMGFLKWDLKHSCSAYETFYAQELEGAFPAEKQKRRQLIYAYGLYHEKRWQEALEPLQSLLRRSRTLRDRRAVLLAMALCLDDLGARTQAEQVYQVLVKENPNYSVARSNLGLILLGQGRFSEAQAQLRLAVSLDRTNAHAWLNLGALHHFLGQYRLAIPPLEEAAARNEKLHGACSTLARCHASLENWEEARRWADLAVQRGEDPGWMDAALENTRSVFRDLSELSPETAALYRSWREKTGKPSIIAGLAPVSRFRSYVGGEPLGTPPVDADGVPMRQLAAIFCEEFPDAGLPAQGLIRIFIAVDRHWGMDLEHPNIQRGFRVLYDREFSHLTPGPRPDDDGFPVRGKLWLTIHTRVTQAMPACDHRFARTFSGEPEDDFCEAVTDAFHRIGGYPCSYQSDPREDPAYAHYDQLLLQLDSMDGGDWGVFIGDGGCMKFCINGEKLAAGDVSDVLYWWD